MKTKKRSHVPFIRRYRFPLLVVVLLVLILAYLNTANNHFYHRLHTARLVWPQYQPVYQIGSPAASVRTYIALGDSLTSGVGADSFDQTYAYLVASQIATPDRSIRLTTESYPGYKTIDIIKHNLDHAVSQKPDIVTILIGNNDVHGFSPSASEFRNNYDEIVSRLHNETSAEIYLIAIPYIGKDSLIWQPYKNYYSARTLSFNTIIKDIATKYGSHYVDLYSATLPYANSSTNYYSRDDFHPSAAGYALWAGIISRDINQHSSTRN